MESEEYWRDHYRWLLGLGYKLRPRYSPEWVPSWRGSKKPFLFFEDGYEAFKPAIMDATRVKDGTLVQLKKVNKSVHPYEVEISSYLSSEQLRADSHNRCVPILDVLDVPNDDHVRILVMPLLREYNDPPFDTVGEGIEFIRQLLEGLQFMHRHYVAHRDINRNNVMMDVSPLQDVLFHPIETYKRYDWKRTWRASRTRTSSPVKYYLIDFGLSRKYNASDLPALEDPIRGGDKTVPEFDVNAPGFGPCDPFATDIYYAGNMIRTDFLLGQLFDEKKSKDDWICRGIHGFDFMWPLVTDMVQDDPAKRPTIDEVVSRFDTIRVSLSQSQLRKRAIRHGENIIYAPFRTVRHWFRRINYMLHRTLAIPAA